MPNSIRKFCSTRLWQSYGSYAKATGVVSMGATTNKEKHNGPTKGVSYRKG